MAQVQKIRQPQNSPNLRWSHPLLRSANYVLLGSQIGTKVHWNPYGKVITYGSLFNPPRRITNQGIAPIFEGSHYFAFPENTANGGTLPWTIAGIFVPTTITNGAAIVGTAEEPGSSTCDRQILYSGTGGNWEAYLFDGGAKRSRSSAVPVVGRPDIVIATSSGSELVCAVKGHPDVSTATVSNGFTGYSSAEFCVGLPNATALQGCGISLLIHARRAWGPSERAEFFSNPWQIFAPCARRVFFTGETAGATFNVAWAVAANTVIQSGARVA